MELHNNHISKRLIPFIGFYSPQLPIYKAIDRCSNPTYIDRDGPPSRMRQKRHIFDTSPTWKILIFASSQNHKALQHNLIW